MPHQTWPGKLSSHRLRYVTAFSHESESERPWRSFPPSAVIPARPRKKRRKSAIEGHIAYWAWMVRRAEADLRADKPVLICPGGCCSYSPGPHPRDALERIIRRGGRTGHRVAIAVAPLDERFRDATEISPARTMTEGRWWHVRETPGTVDWTCY